MTTHGRLVASVLDPPGHILPVAGQTRAPTAQTPRLQTNRRMPFIAGGAQKFGNPRLVPV